MTQSRCASRPPPHVGAPAIQVAPRQGFWSYVVRDDEHEQGRIRQLAEDVAAEYEATTAEAVELFFGQADLKWGDDWRQRIDEALESAAFFIPVITPRFFQSMECRREFRRFLGRARALGVTELLLPIYYRTVDALEGEPPEDHPDKDLLNAIRQTQWKDWRDLRFQDRSSEEYRRAVASVVNRLVEASRKIESAPSDSAVAASSGGGDEAVERPEEEPGDLDSLADFEQELPRWVEIHEGANDAIVAINTMMRAAVERIQSPPDEKKRFVYAKLITHKLAQDLVAPIDRLGEAGKDLSGLAQKLDPGARILFTQAVEAVRSGDPDAAPAAKKLLGNARSLATSTAKLKEGGRKMIVTLGPLTRLSRDLRPVVRRLRQAVTVFIEAGDVTRDWVAFIDELEGS